MIRNMRETLRRHRWAAGVISASTLVMVYYELTGYAHFLWPVLDLGLFNRHLWGLAHFSLSANPLKGINLLADHAHFILVGLVPFYWIWPSPVVLLVAQALAVGLSGIPFYLLARRVTGSRLAATLWLLPYYSYFGFWAMLGYPFHEVALAVPLLMLALYWLVTGRYVAMAVSLMALMLVKEDMPLVVIMFGLYLLVIKRHWKLGLGLMVVAAGYFGWLMDFWFPLMNHGTYIYDNTSFGHGFGGIVRAVFLRPVAFVQALFLPATKLRTVGLMLMSFGVVLPLLGLEFFLLIIPLWLGRFLSTQDWRWSPTEHYSADQGPILAVAAVVGGARVLGWLPKIPRRWGWSALVGICLIGSLYPALSDRPHYLGYLFERHFEETTAADVSVNEAMKLIPKDASVGVQSAFPQLTSREQAYNLPVDLTKTRPDYLLMGLPFDFYGFSSQQAIMDYVTAAEQHGGYRGVYDRNGVFLLKRD